MRVLIENNAYAPNVTGGAELSVQGIAEGLAKRGHNVSVLTAEVRDEEEELAGVRIIRRRFAGLMSYADHRQSKRSVKKAVNKLLVIDNPANAPIMDAVILDVRPDVVLSNNLLGVTPEFWRAARRANVPIMHTTRDFSLMCPNSVLMCKRYKNCEQPLPHCALMRCHMRAACRLVDVVSAPSRYALDVHLRDGYFSHARTCVVPNAVGFDSAIVQSAIHMRKTRASAGLLRVCYLGRLAPEKGILVLVGALCALWAEGLFVELHVAGKGPLESLLEEYAREGIPLYLHGFLSQDEVNELLLSTDVLTVPSLCGETFGRVVLDAYAHAMPAVVSDVGALPEVLKPETGVVVPPGDEETLARAIRDYLTNPLLVMDQGVAGAQVLGAYTLSNQVQQFEVELERLCDASCVRTSVTSGATST